MRDILVHELVFAARHFRRDKRDVARERSLVRDVDRSADALESLVAVDQTSPSEAAARGDEVLAFADALQQLPEAQRRAVLARHIEIRPLHEIAESMKRSPVAVAGLLRRGLAQLRKFLAAASGG